MTRRNTNNERGSIMLTTVVSIFALIGMLGFIVLL